ncbi:MAG: putative integrin-like protein [Myxococcaceae bacterium]|nr:putative integrin-like protein [Myxococcaceae bacterium]
MQLRALALLIAVALGCTDTVAPAGQCRFDSDCDEGLVCAGTFCRAQCSTDRDCLAGQRCSESDRFGVLTCHAVVAQAQCNRTSDCPVGLSCLDGACRAQCQQDYDCQVINPYYRCVANACALTCAAGQADCDGDPRNGCEATLAGNPRHCLACGTACSAGPHADAVCAATGCAARCQAGFADCDGSAADGCEVELASDAANCGACGRACTANMVCSGGACASSCAAGTTLCGASCVDLRTSATSCGSCGHACPTAPNAAPACAASACAVVCNAGYVATSAGCAAVAAPRLLSPPSLSTFNGNRNLVFEVAPAGPADGAAIELCRDRACATVIERFVGATARVVRSGPLAPGIYFWRAYGRVGAVTGLAPSAQTWEVRVPARAIDGTAAWGNLLDVNGDGNPDVAVGESRSHRVHVYLGTATGVPARPTATIASTDPESSFGRELAAGDFNGDGFADLAVNAPDSRDLFVYAGGAAGLGAAGARRISPAGAPYSTIAAASDLNHDGYADLVAGYHFCTKGCVGGVDVFFGGPAGLAMTPTTLTYADRFSDFGERLAAVGRVSPDSPYESIVVLASSKGPGAALVYRGTAAGIATTPTQTVRASFQAVQVAAADDVDGDGFADVAVLEQNFTGGAQLLVYRGSATGLAAAALTTVTSDLLSASLASVGDVNGDGFADLVASDGFAVARVFLGAATGPMTLGPLFSAPVGADGARTYARFGGATARVGDLNRDGFDDLAIGAPDDGDSVCRGALLVYPGRATFTAPFTPSIVLTVPDDACSGNFGGAIASYARPRRAAPHS